MYYARLMYYARKIFLKYWLTIVMNLYIASVSFRIVQGACRVLEVLEILEKSWKSIRSPKKSWKVLEIDQKVLEIAHENSVRTLIVSILIDSGKQIRESIGHLKKK